MARTSILVKPHYAHPRYSKPLVVVPKLEERERSELHIDDIDPILNPVKAMDLRQILTLVPPYDRPRMALAFASMTYELWGELGGFTRNSVNRWVLKREIRLPFGVAMRLSKVIGIPAEELFADWM